MKPVAWDPAKWKPGNDYDMGVTVQPPIEATHETKAKASWGEWTRKLYLSAMQLHNAEKPLEPSALRGCCGIVVLNNLSDATSETLLEALANRKEGLACVSISYPSQRYLIPELEEAGFVCVAVGSNWIYKDKNGQSRDDGTDGHDVMLWVRIIHPAEWFNEDGTLTKDGKKLTNR